MKQSEGGFTIPELMVVMIITSLFVSLIMMFMFSYWRYGLSLEADLDTLVTRLNAGDILREQIGESSGLVTQNSIADQHANNPDPSISSGLYWQPIHAVPGNKTASASATTPLLYYRRFSTDNNKAVIMNGTQPYEDEYVLYLDGATKQVLTRSLANPSASGNRLKTSCPPTQATPSCPADKVVATNIASIDLRYFSRAGNLIDFNSVYDPVIASYIGPDFPVVEVAEFTLNIAAKPIFQQTDTTKNSTIIRIALRDT